MPAPPRAGRASTERERLAGARDDPHVADGATLLEDARAPDVRDLRGRVSEVRHQQLGPFDVLDLLLGLRLAGRERRRRTALDGCSRAPAGREHEQTEWSSRCTAARGCSARPRTRFAAGLWPLSASTDWSIWIVSPLMSWSISVLSCVPVSW